MEPSGKIIIVEGNISAGKSTLCRSLQEELDCALFLEPTVANPFLEKFYKDPKKYALPLQLWILKQRYVTYVNAIKFIFNNPSVSGVILDRSIFSDIVFAEKNYKDGNFSREGYDYYLQLREQLLAHLPAPHVVLHLDVSAMVCFDRIHNLRKRDCEGGIPLDYLTGLEECYQNFVAQMRSTSRVLSLPWTDFGASTDVVSALQKELDSLHGAATWRDADAVREFVFDPDTVNRRMRMPHTIPEAGCDVEAMDPDVVTRKEALVMPSRKRAATPSTSGSAEEGDFATPRSALEQSKLPTPTLSPPRKHAKRPGTFPGTAAGVEAEEEAEHQLRPQRTLNL